jgi:anti-sigma B factor antagonist
MKPTTPLNTTISRAPGEVVLTLVGEIDTLTAPAFEAAADAMGAGRKVTVVFDLAGVTFMDSTGLTIIAGTLRRLNRVGGRLCIRGASPMICRLLEITGIEQSEILEISPIRNNVHTAANG